MTTSRAYAVLAPLAALTACGGDDRPAAPAPGPAPRDAATGPGRAIPDARPAPGDAGAPGPSSGDAGRDATAGAVDAGAATARPSARCRGLPDDGTVEVLPAHGDRRGYHVRASEDARWLVFEDARRCEVIPVGRAEARARGAFWPGVGDVKAFALSGPECDREDIDPCELTVALRDDAGHVLDATQACASRESTALIAAEVFDGQPSLVVVCRRLTGWGYDEDLSLLHVVDGQLAELLRVPGTWADHGPSDACQGCGAYCFTQLDEARWRVLERGAAPVLETRSPDGYLVQAGDPEVKPTPNVVRWTFDRAARRFVAASKRRVPTTARRDACAPLEPRSPLR